MNSIQRLQLRHLRALQCRNQKLNAKAKQLLEALEKQAQEEKYFTCADCYELFSLEELTQVSLYRPVYLCNNCID